MNDLFHLLKLYDIQFTSPVPDHLKCVICKMVLNDSCFAPCGCKFCSTCITEYLCNENKICPGEKEECLGKFLNVRDDVIKDAPGNTQISYLKVRCPHPNCSFECQLKKLFDHMKEHYNSSSDCNSSMDGSSLEKDGKKLSKNSVKLKLHEMEKILNQSLSEMADLRRDNEIIRSELAVLKRNHNELAAIKRKLNEIENKQVVTAGNSPDIICLDRDDNKQLVNETITVEETPPEKRRRIGLKKTDREMLQLQKNGDSSKKPVENRSLTMENSNLKLIGHGEKRKEVEVYYWEPKKQQKELSKILTDSSDSQQNQYTWKITNIINKYQSNKWEYSSPFLSDGSTGGYKMRLYFWLSKFSDGLWIAFQLMRGVDDDNLDWPMKRVVELEIVNQETDCGVLSKQFSISTAGDRQPAYGRPENFANDSFDGFVAFRSHQELLQLPGVIKDDCMTVRCRVLSARR